MRAAPTVMPSILICWFTTSEADVGDTAVEVEPSPNIPLYFVAVQMAAEGQPGKMVSDTEVRVKQRCVTQFLHVEKMANSDIHQCLLYVKGDQTVDVSIMRQ